MCLLATLGGGTARRGLFWGELEARAEMDRLGSACFVLAGRTGGAEVLIAAEASWECLLCDVA